MNKIFFNRGHPPDLFVFLVYALLVLYWTIKNIIQTGPGFSMISNKYFPTRITSLSANIKYFSEISNPSLKVFSHNSIVTQRTMWNFITFNILQQGLAVACNKIWRLQLIATAYTQQFALYINVCISRANRWKIWFALLRISCCINVVQCGDAISIKSVAITQQLYWKFYFLY